MQLLLIEPHAALARALRWGLEEEGFTVRIARDGEEASGLVERQRHDVIMVDLNRPRDEGFRLLRKWRQAGVSTPVLLLMVHKEDWTNQPACDLEPYRCLEKPFELDNLLVLLRTLTNSRRDSRASSLFHCFTCRTIR